MIQQKRINWIDWAKVFGIFLVVFGHGLFIEQTVPIQTFIYSFHMPFFFILSGYLHKDSNEFRPYLLKKIKTLLVPYLILPILACSYYIPYSIHFGGFDIGKIIYAYLTGNAYNLPGGACWFIYCMFIVNILAYFVLKLPKWLQAIVVGICFLLVYCRVIPFNFRIDAAFIALLFFLLGYYLRQFNVLIYFTKKYVISICCIVLFLILVFSSQANGHVDMHNANFGHSFILYYFNAIVGSLMLIFFSMLFDNLTNKFVQVISSGALLIIALHAPSYVFKILNEHIAVGDGLYIPINLLLTIVNILLLYYPIIFIKKKFPFVLGGR